MKKENHGEIANLVINTLRAFFDRCLFKTEVYHLPSNNLRPEKNTVVDLLCAWRKPDYLSITLSTLPVEVKINSNINQTAINGSKKCDCSESGTLTSNQYK